MNPPHKQDHSDARQNHETRDPALEAWLQKLREMHRPEEEAVPLEM